MKTKNLTVTAKGIKNSPKMNLVLNILKSNKKKFEVIKPLPVRMGSIKLTNSKWTMLKVYPNTYQTMSSFPVEEFDISGLTWMTCMFCNCASLTSVDLSSLDTSNITDMSQLFENCTSLTAVDLSSLDTSKVKTMYNMFYNNAKLASVNLSGLDVNSLENMNYMFEKCSSLVSVDLSSFDTGNVARMTRVFYACSSLTTIEGVIDMKSVSNINYAYNMFAECPNLKGVKIKNPPAGFTSHDASTGLNKAGLKEDQYTIVS